MKLNRVDERPSGYRRVWPFLALLLVLGVLAGLFYADRTKPEAPPTLGMESALMFSLPRVGGPTGYVTSASCRECHPRQYDSWHRSYHRTMTQLMTTNTVLADFNSVSLEFMGERFILNRQGNNFSATIVDLDELTAPTAGTNTPVTAVKVPMGLVTGSHHMQVFWLPGGAGNMQIGFPFTWLIQDKRWVPRNDAFIRDPNTVPSKEIWNLTCIRCHVTAGQPRPDRTRNLLDTRVGELGIACEACHGPALDHVRYEREHRRDPHDPAAGSQESRTAVAGDAAAAKIVQPRDLNHVRGSQVCGSCHSIKWFDDSEGWKEEGFRYRPGDDLEQTTPIIRPGHLAEQPALQKVLAKHPDILQDFFWPDGMIRVAGREYNGLLESPCFQRGKLSCLSCHSLHQSDPNDQLARGMEGNEACLQCHEKHRRDLTRHTHHAPGSTGSQCYNCHMPHTTYGLLKAIRSHQITSPSVAATVQTGRPNACNLCHLDQTLAWTGKHLAQWFGRETPALTNEQQTLAAGILWLQKGDASQRALAAWSAGWEPSRSVSGGSWQSSHLAELLDDPYAAVRYIAEHALKQFPGFADFSYDFVGPPSERATAKERAGAVLRQTARPVPADFGARVMLRPDGTLDQSLVRTLQEQRDNRPVRLRE